MTRAQTHAYELGLPSLSQLLLAATLCVLAEFVQIIARLFDFGRPSLTAECDGCPAQGLEAGDVGDQQEKTDAAASSTRSGLIGSASAFARRFPVSSSSVKTSRSARYYASSPDAPA